MMNIRQTIKSYPTCKTETLIHLLNPKIRGWANYFRGVVSKETFSYVDNQTFWAVWRWARRRHPRKGKRWIWEKYFPHPYLKGCLTTTIYEKGTPKTLSLVRASKIPIRRHIKTKAAANPYDPQFFSYFETRDRLRRQVQAQPPFGLVW